MKAPGATCPWIDELARIIRRNARGEDRRKGLALCEQLRGANQQLRLCYSDAAIEARDLRRSRDRDVSGT